MPASATIAEPSLRLDQLLTRAASMDASDVHLVVGSPPTFRIHGALRPASSSPLTADQVDCIIREICPAHVLERFEQTQDADFAYRCELDGLVRRFRVNVFRATGSSGLSARILMESIPTFEWAGFPVGVAARVSSFRNGLVLFTGITGSGKSTTMAMLIEMINQRGDSRIITIEEPIEYLFEPKDGTIISQREVGTDVRSFADGLKYGLRQDPDMILVGEIRDRDTAQMAVSAAETGHLVLSTMHTRDAKGAITRLADMFHLDAQQTIRTQLAMSLRAVISQHLVSSRNKSARRLLAVEVMFNTLPVMSAIRSGKIEAIDDAILGGRSDGMICLDDSLRQLVQAGDIDIETARRYANDPKRMG